MIHHFLVRLNSCSFQSHLESARPCKQAPGNQDLIEQIGIAIKVERAIQCTLIILSIRYGLGEVASRKIVELGATRALNISVFAQRLRVQLKGVIKRIVVKITHRNDRGIFALYFANTFMPIP